MLIDQSYVFKYFEKRLVNMIFSEFFFNKLNRDKFILSIFKK